MGIVDLSAPTNSNRIYLRPDSSDPYWTQADPVKDAVGIQTIPESIYTSIPTVIVVNGVNKWQDSILQHPSALRITLIFRCTASDTPIAPAQRCRAQRPEK